MESRATRKALTAFPPDLAFTKDPTDDLRKFLDIAGRQIVIAGEYMRDQLDNIALRTANVNDPYYYYTSGQVVGLNATLSGNWLQDAQDLTTMEVTGFDYVEEITPSGLNGAISILGISYADQPDASGQVYISRLGSRTINVYNWPDLSTVSDTFEASLEIQTFDQAEKDEYLVIENDDALGKIAHLEHTPVGDIVVTDTKNLQAPWAPDTSDGIIVDSAEITVSGSTLLLTSPRPSYSPATTLDGVVTYPTDYQPDQTWQSSFIVEYNYYTKDAPYGLTQRIIRHELGQPGIPAVAAEDVEE